MSKKIEEENIRISYRQTKLELSESLNKDIDNVDTKSTIDVTVDGDYI
jgi:hypothetical protein